MSRLDWVGLPRQLARRGSGWHPHVLAVGLGFAFAVHALAFGQRLVEHMGEMAAVPPEARLQVTAATDGDPAAVAADLARLRALPGVRAAAWFEAPLRATWLRPELFTAGDRRWVGWSVAAGEGAGETLALELLAGRLPSAGDGARPGPVPVVVSRSFLEELGPGAAVGTRLRSVERGADLEVVGVVEDFLSHGHMRTSRSLVLWPAPAAAPHLSTYLVRVDEGAVAATAPRAAAALGRPGRLVQVASAAELREAAAREAYGTRGLLLTLVAAILASVLLGSGAVSAFRVLERRRHLGVMRALGARPADLALLVVAEGALATLAGLALGLLLSVPLFSVVAPLIPHLTLRAGTLALAGALFLAAGTLAAVVPALRAARVPPSLASRAS